MLVSDAVPALSPSCANRTPAIVQWENPRGGCPAVEGGFKTRARNREIDGIESPPHRPSRTIHPRIGRAQGASAIFRVEPACQEEVESQLHSEDIFAAWIGADVLGWRVPASWCSAASERVQRVTR
jgi:hypothetical protein